MANRVILLFDFRQQIFQFADDCGEFLPFNFRFGDNHCVVAGYFSRKMTKDGTQPPFDFVPLGRFFGNFKSDDKAGAAPIPVTFLVLQPKEPPGDQPASFENFLEIAFFRQTACFRKHFKPKLSGNEPAILATAPQNDFPTPGGAAPFQKTVGSFPFSFFGLIGGGHTIARD